MPAQILVLVAEDEELVRLTGVPSRARVWTFSFGGWPLDVVFAMVASLKRQNLGAEAC
jgi:hypothetical protein